MKKLWAGVLLIVAISCGKDDAAITDFDTTVLEWLSTNSITAVRDDSGIYYYSITDNFTGTPVTSGSVASIYYTLSDLDGNTIASHQRANGDSLHLKQGVSAVFPVGLDVGLSFMREGETYGLILPPNLGYGDLTSGAIASNLVTLLEVEVTAVQEESAFYTQELTTIDNYIISENLNDTVANPLNMVEQFASGVAYKRLVKGFGPLPINGETVVVDYTAAYLNNATFDSQSSFEYTIGTNVPRPLIPGFEFGLSLMQPNEQSLVIVPSSQAYRESARIIPGFLKDDLIADSIIPDYVSTVDPYTTLVFTITRFD